MLRERVLHPKAHRAAPFDLTAEEWAATRELLLLVRAELHPHLHVIPRFDDEPMAGQGVRSGIKNPASRRPDPWRPGTGKHMTAPRARPRRPWHSRSR